MKKSSILLISCLAIACGQKKEAPITPEAAETPVTFVVKKDARKIGPEKPPEQTRIEEAIEKLQANADMPCIGYWVGMFGKNKINIAIAEIKDGKAIGYTVCAGNFRPVTGTATASEDLYQIVLDEPGTDQYDGHFVFSIHLKNNSLEGTWTPFKKGIVADKTFTLTKRAYTYDPENGMFPESSSRLLSESDVSNLNEEELGFMRNEIYARHGYSFKDLQDRRQFDTVTWYIPMGIDVRQKLTDIEVQNIDLIYRYEEYYHENYDDYGR
ncbi:YARHG domain-containing protein [Dawidia soli]|uniref:YARHG domain-containing protein n=1 Tax=Dawidia soli TaxID=2782352 RepID=A0AAP2D980_9BACT|nr:YARHG domain-containing protein [Dawidia soli]MBT1686801.1 YARHG domain-containing protein [Dawidia soli]